MTKRAFALGAVLFAGCSGDGCPCGDVSPPGPSGVDVHFTNPALPSVSPLDMGVAVAPYAWATADSSFHVTWDDGDGNPTATFSFYFLDHEPNFYTLYDIDPTQVAAPMTERGNPLVPVTVWASCNCTDDGGTECPHLDGGRLDSPGPQDCRNDFVWDTSGVPEGSYWPIALTKDGAFTQLSIAGAPVRVSHTATSPPAVIVLRPDGYGSYDRSYRAQWLAIGTLPLTFDLAYGIVGSTPSAMPVTLQLGIPGVLGADGTQTYDWDTSGLKSWTAYYLRVTVTDGAGVKAFSDSGGWVSVYHRPP